MSSVFRLNRGPKVRAASHAGSWYSDDPTALRTQIQQFLDNAPVAFEDGTAPVEDARVVIAPHAGYRYSGWTAGVAYKAFALKPDTKNIFVLGPSHHVYMDMATVSCCDELETPFGNMIVNKDINEELQGTGLFGTVSKKAEEDEHSMELHFPFVKFLIDKIFIDVPADKQPRVVPIMIGNTNPTVEKQIGEALAPYLKDSQNVFVVSSDFCHWGRRFSHTYYVTKQKGDFGDGISLRSDSQVDPSTAIHESIKRVDDACMQAISTGHREIFLHALSKTNNTVCGRHPISVMMAMIETLKTQLSIHGDLCRFTFTDYERSQLVDKINDSSVSYVAGYAKVKCMDVPVFISQIQKLRREDGLSQAVMAYADYFDHGSQDDSYVAGKSRSRLILQPILTDSEGDRYSSLATDTNKSATPQLPQSRQGPNTYMAYAENKLRTILRIDCPENQRFSRVESNDSMKAMAGD